MTSVEDFRRVKFRTIAIRGQDDVDGGGRYADEPIDLTVATHAVWLRGAILFGAGLLVLVGYGTFMVAAKPAKCGQPMSPVR